MIPIARPARAHRHTRYSPPPPLAHSCQEKLRMRVAWARCWINDHFCSDLKLLCSTLNRLWILMNLICSNPHRLCLIMVLSASSCPHLSRKEYKRGDHHAMLASGRTQAYRKRSTHPSSSRLSTLEQKLTLRCDRGLSVLRKQTYKAIFPINMISIPRTMYIRVRPCR